MVRIMSMLQIHFSMRILDLGTDCYTNRQFEQIFYKILFKIAKVWKKWRRGKAHLVSWKRRIWLVSAPVIRCGIRSQSQSQSHLLVLWVRQSVLIIRNVQLLYHARRPEWKRLISTYFPCIKLRTLLFLSQAMFASYIEWSLASSHGSQSIVCFRVVFKRGLSLL